MQQFFNSFNFTSLSQMCKLKSILSLIYYIGTYRGAIHIKRRLCTMEWLDRSTKIRRFHEIFVLKKNNFHNIIIFFRFWKNRV